MTIAVELIMLQNYIGEYIDELGDNTILSEIWDWLNLIIRDEIGEEE